MNADVLQVPARGIPTAPPLQFRVPEPRRKRIHLPGMYLLALLPLLVTLLFLAIQLTSWGDACPPEAPCESSW